jgi:hypothetical protein
MKTKTAQIPLFPQGNDLPLFSGTAPTAQIDPFKATPPAPKQLSLFELPQKNEAK